MTYVKWCKKHGTLTWDQVHQWKKRGKPYLRCMACEETTKDRHKETQAKIVKKEIKEGLAILSREKRLAYHRRYNKKRSENLSNSYITTVLTANGSKLKAKDIPPELLELKRVHLRLKRAIKDARDKKDL